MPSVQVSIATIKRLESSHFKCCLYYRSTSASVIFLHFQFDLYQILWFQIFLLHFPAAPQFTLLNPLLISIKNRAVFKWLSKVITWLQLLGLVIGLKDLRQFFNQWESKPKPIAPCTHDFSRASSELQLIARNRDWFITLAAPVVIGRNNCFGFGFSIVIWKPL